jgi:uncharacterized protein GlcG (DUF336 family)
LKKIHRDALSAAVFRRQFVYTSLCSHEPAAAIWEGFMSLSVFRCGALALGGMLASVLAGPASAQLINEKSLSAAMVVTMAQTALETCKASGYRVSITVLGHAGEVLIQLRGDGASPHTMENSQRKAYTSRTFRVPSAEWAENLAKNPLRPSQFLTGVIALAGGLPIKVGDEVIGAIGVSGAPGGEKDEVCAKAAIDKVADQLK